MTYEQYELFVKSYLQRKLHETFGRYIEIKHQENLKTSTERVYNIDLSYKFNIGTVEYLTIIECKNWKTTVTRDIILALKEKGNELNAHKTILVTTKGFQSGAIKYAKEKGIGLMKMTTKGEVETFSNYIGTDFTNLFNNLRVETDISEEEEISDNIGVIFPNSSVRYYLERKFGKTFLDILSEFQKNVDSTETSRFDNKAINLIESIPDNWYKEYETIETCGLPLKLFNDLDIRFYFRFIYLLKLSINNDMP